MYSLAVAFPSNMSLGGPGGVCHESRSLSFEVCICGNHSAPVCVGCNVPCSLSHETWSELPELLRYPRFMQFSDMRIALQALSGSDFSYTPSSTATSSSLDGSQHLAEDVNRRQGTEVDACSPSQATSPLIKLPYTISNSELADTVPQSCTNSSVHLTR